MLTHSVDEGKVDGVHLDFSKALDTVSQHSGEIGCTVCWVKKLAGSSDPEKGGEWCHIQLVAGH